MTTVAPVNRSAKYDPQAAKQWAAEDFAISIGLLRECPFHGEPFKATSEGFMRKAITARRRIFCSRIGGFADFRAFSQRHNAKRRSRFMAFANHVKVANLKNLQRQKATRVQHAAQRKER